MATTLSETLLLLGVAVAALASLGVVMWVMVKIGVFVVLRFTKVYIPETDLDAAATSPTSTTKETHDG